MFLACFHNAEWLSLSSGASSLSRVQLSTVDLKSCLLQFAQDLFQLLWMVIETSLGECQWVIDVGSKEFQSVEQHGHFLLKDVRTVTQAHGQLLHLALSERKD